MRIRLNLAGVRFFASLSRYTKVTGVNSKLPGGKHFLMWDFDNVERWKVQAILETVQAEWKLPNIYLRRCNDAAAS